MNPAAGKIVYENWFAKVTVFSEYATDDKDDYIEIVEQEELSPDKKHIVIGGVQRKKEAPYIYMICDTEEYMRYKYVLTSEEEARGLINPNPLPPKIVEFAGVKILPLICKEILYPEYWPDWFMEPLDFIVHIVGYPMYDVHQYKAWQALHKAAMRFYNCPLICVAGRGRGPEISGIYFPGGSDANK